MGEWVNKIVDFIPFLKNGSLVLKITFTVWVLSSIYIVISYIGFKVNEKNNKILEETTLQSNINYSVFIDKLGNNSETVRNSAILELGEILKKDSRNHNKIIKILISHINEYAGSIDKNIDIRENHKIKLEIQNAFEIIGNREKKYDEEQELKFNDLNLNGIQLDSLDLSNMDFIGSQFVKSQISNVNFDNSFLDCTDFRNTSLINCSLCNASIGASKFYFSDISNCSIENSHLGNTHFNHIRFKNTSLKNTTMISTFFEKSNLVDVLNLNQDKLYWAFGNENEIPKGYTLLNKPLITVSNGNENETKYNRAPVVREISFEGAENEVEVLKFLLNANGLEYKSV